MNEFLEAILLGAVQGITEFLPISSSGHLILFKQYFTSPLLETIFFDVSLHIATALAILIYFRKEISDLFLSFFKILSGTYSIVSQNHKSLILGITIGTIPAGIIGLLFQSKIEELFRNPSSVAFALIAGSILFLIAEKYATQDKTISAMRAFIVGLFQVCALVPGFSRSGATISGGLLQGLTREDSAKLSFFLALPIIAGAGLKSAMDIDVVALSSHELLVILAGGVSAFLVGLLAVDFLMKFLKKNSLKSFVVYRIVLALIVLFVFGF